MWNLAYVKEKAFFQVKFSNTLKIPKSETAG